MKYINDSLIVLAIAHSSQSVPSKHEREVQWRRKIHHVQTVSAAELKKVAQFDFVLPNQLPKGFRLSAIEVGTVPARTTTPKQQAIHMVWFDNSGRRVDVIELPSDGVRPARWFWIAHINQVFEMVPFSQRLTFQNYCYNKNVHFEVTGEVSEEEGNEILRALEFHPITKKRGRASRK